MASELVPRKLRSGGERLTAILVDDEGILAMGDQALVSSDGGTTFTPVTQLGRVQALLAHDGAVYAAGEQFGFSRDRGATWTPISVPTLRADTGGNGLMMCIHRHRNGTWMIGGYGGILGWKAPGGEWRELCKSSMVSQVSEHFGKTYVVGYEQATLRGERLTTIKALRQQANIIAGIVETPKGTLVAYGESLIAQQRRAAIFRSVDRGTTWKWIDPPIHRDLHAAAVIAGDIYIVGEAGTILRSADDGKTFTQVKGGGSARLWAITSAGEDAIVCGDEGVILRLAAAGARPAKSAKPSKRSKPASTKPSGTRAKARRR